MDIGPPELLIVLVIVVVLFGADRLPKLARSLGRAQREFRSGAAGVADDPVPTPSPADDPVRSPRSDVGT